VKHKSLQLTAENIHAITAVIPVAASRNGQSPTSRKAGGLLDERKHDHLFLRKTNCSDYRNFSTSFEHLPRVLQTTRLTDVVNVYAYFKLLYWPARSVLSLSFAYERKYRNYKLSSQTRRRRSILVRTLVSAGELSLSCARVQTASWMGDYLAVKPSAIGQPTWPTEPSIPQGSVNK